jgi:hypothetical protein
VFSIPQNVGQMAFGHAEFDFMLECRQRFGQWLSLVALEMGIALRILDESLSQMSNSQAPPEP